MNKAKKMIAAEKEMGIFTSEMRVLQLRGIDLLISQAEEQLVRLETQSKSIRATLRELRDHRAKIASHKKVVSRLI